jgi:hypothetical protein
VKLKLDENLGRSARDEFAGGGHEVATVPEQSLNSATDDALIDACRERRGTGAASVLRLSRASWISSTSGPDCASRRSPHPRTQRKRRFRMAHCRQAIEPADRISQSSVSPHITLQNHAMSFSLHG